jgi:hypothetical protein
MIVHIPISELSRTPLPFLNRFEKYILSVEEIYKEQVQKLPGQRMGEMQRIFDVVSSGLTDFVDFMKPSCFYGLVPKETVNSFLSAIVESTIKTGTNSPVIPPAFSVVETGSQNNQNLDSEEAEETEENLFEDDMVRVDAPASPRDPGRYIREFIRKANFHLMQIARPEAVYLMKSSLPRAYLIEYLLTQEHFSILRFLHRLFRSAFFASLRQPHQANKWVIYTRTSAELYTLPTNLSLQKLLLEPILIAQNVKVLISTMT